MGFFFLGGGGGGLTVLLFLFLILVLFVIALYLSLLRSEPRVCLIYSIFLYYCFSDTIIMMMIY